MTPDASHPAPASDDGWLSAIVETAMDAIVITDRDQRIVFANPATARVFGWEPAELIGQSLDVLIPSVVRARHAAHVERFGTEGVTTRPMESRRDLPTGSIRGLRRNGDEFPLEASISTFHTAEGRRYAATLRDITERLRLEAERRASERLLDSVIANLPIVLTVADRDGEITLSKGGALGPLGVAPGEQVGQSIFQLFGSMPAVVGSETTTVADVARRAMSGEVVESRTTLPGNIEHRNLTIPFRDGTGAVVGLVGLSQDVTRQLNLEGQLRQAQKMQAVGQLAGGIAHDFNNLLTVLTANLEFAGADLPRELPEGHPLHAALGDMAHAIDRARVLVAQLLTFSRAQPVRLQLVCVEDTLRNTLPLLERLLGEEVRLAFACTSGTAAVRAGAGQLEQIVLNLAVNARDAMLTAAHGHPGRGGTLTITGEQMDGDIRLTVTDTGHGMDAATRARIFEPFFTTKPLGRGTGLGLATVYGIVEQVGGRITVDSELGRGSTFTVYWPMASDARPDDTGDGRWPSPVAAPIDTQAPSTRGTLLLVEDDAAVRAVTRRVLERGGYDVIEARHGSHALEIWAQQAARIAAVITDCRMPEMGGRDLAHALRVARPGLPVVFLSGYAEEETMPATGEAFLGKPFATDHLLHTVASLLRDSAREADAR